MALNHNIFSASYVCLLYFVHLARKYNGWPSSPAAVKLQQQVQLQFQFIFGQSNNLNFCYTRSLVKVIM